MKQYGVKKLKTAELELELADEAFAAPLRLPEPSNTFLSNPVRDDDENMLFWSTPYFQGKPEPEAEPSEAPQGVAPQSIPAEKP